MAATRPPLDAALKAGQKSWRVRLTAAHALSQKLRKRIEEIFGWAKTTGGFRKSRYRGVERTHAQGQYVVTAWNLVRMAKLLVTGTATGRLTIKSDMKMVPRNWGPIGGHCWGWINRRTATWPEWQPEQHPRPEPDVRRCPGNRSCRQRPWPC